MALEKVVELWHGWEVRILVLLSLLLQVVLIIFGSQRKNTRIIWINLIVWLAYLTADWVATVSLGTLARSKGIFEDSSQSNNILEAFWAPFLLLHLGGPDTITAYSLEDNELWLRHFLGLVVQVGVAFYVFLRSWNNLNAVRFLAIMMFITGVIKYGERTLVLRSSSAKQLKDSLRSSHDESGLDFDQIVEELKKGKELRFSQSNTKEDESDDKRNYYLVEADLLFNKCRSLFADLILDHYERKESYFLIHNKSTKDAFKLVAVELGFMYDLLYTKATIIYSRWGIFLRCFCIFSHVSVSVVFLIIIDKEEYSPGDVYITYVLLFGAVFLDVYALIILLFSDWTKLWLTKRNFFLTGDTCSYGLHSNNRRRWSGSMGQYNLLSFCLADISTKTTRISKLFGIKGLLEKYQYLNWKDVDDDLQDRIFKKVLENSKKIEGDSFNIKSCKELLVQRGDLVLSERLPSSSTAFLQFPDQLRWSTIDVEFDHSLLLWHIATDLCYIEGPKYTNELLLECKISKCISDYMLYLLLVCPTMLPKGNGEIRYRETCAEAMRYFKRKSDEKYETITKNEAFWTLLEVDTSRLEEIKGDRNLSVLYYGCKLTKELKRMKSVCHWSNEKFWEIISEVWIEMLTYAASHCGWKEHSRQIMKGGELLTHVCLLMAHFGLSDQYQIQKERFDVGPGARVVGPLRRQNAFKENSTPLPL